MKALVTGVAGFIGSHLAGALLASAALLSIPRGAARLTPLPEPVAAPA